VDECKPLVEGPVRRARGGGDQAQGRAVQVDPIKPKLKPPGTKRLKLEYDGLLSNFGFKFNLRCYIKARCAVHEEDEARERRRRAELSEHLWGVMEDVARLGGRLREQERGMLLPEGAAAAAPDGLALVLAGGGAGAGAGSHCTYHTHGGGGGGGGRSGGYRDHHGRAVQVDPIKPMLKPRGTKRLKVKCDILLSTFAFKFNLRRYTMVMAGLSGPRRRTSWCRRRRGCAWRRARWRGRSR